jgi:D-amino-acid oxidase
MNRRQLVMGAAAWAACRAAAGEPRLLGGRPRAAPNFLRLVAERPRVVGIRPHRARGVRLELLTSGEKRMVLHYGHGGAGLTLAWGCARELVAMVEQGGAPSSIAVIGVGVAGLCSATELRRRFPSAPLTLYAKDLSLTATTSWLAAGQFEPSGIHRAYTDASGRARLEGWLRAAVERLSRLDADRYGVSPRDQFMLDRADPALAAVPSDVIAPVERGLLPFPRLQSPGLRARTWLVNPTTLLPALRDDLTAAGARWVRRDFAALGELWALSESLVVVCPGYGARALLRDDEVVPQRGHLVRLERDDPDQDWFFSGGCADGAPAYVFCRQRDIVVGGTVIAGDDEPALRPSDDAVFDRILKNGLAIFAGHPERCGA